MDIGVISVVSIIRNRLKCQCVLCFVFCIFDFVFRIVIMCVLCCMKLKYLRIISTHWTKYSILLYTLYLIHKRKFGLILLIWKWGPLAKFILHELIQKVKVFHLLPNSSIIVEYWIFEYGSRRKWFHPFRIRSIVFFSSFSSSVIQDLHSTHKYKCGVYNRQTQMECYCSSISSLAVKIRKIEYDFVHSFIYSYSIWVLNGMPCVCLVDADFLGSECTANILMNSIYVPIKPSNKPFVNLQMPSKCYV